MYDQNINANANCVFSIVCVKPTNLFNRPRSLELPQYNKV